MVQSSDVRIRARHRGPAVSDPDPDGRSARRDRNRLAVIDAAVELFSEGNLRPTATEVALRCGLSPKSVSRYFEDIDSLIAAAAARQMEIVISLFQIHAIGAGRSRAANRRFRADAARGARGDGWDLSGGQLSGLQAALGAKTSRRGATPGPQADRASVRARTGPAPAHPASQARTAAIDALVQFESLDYLREHRKFSFNVAHATLVEALSLLLRD